MAQFRIVYVLSNAAMPGLVKIGMTASEDAEARLAQLYTTGVPFRRGSAGSSRQNRRRVSSEGEPCSPFTTPPTAISP